jgi:hypothetical protein
MQFASPTAPARVGILMAFEAATFAGAAVVHFGIGLMQAAIPETVIAVVLGVGSSAVLQSRIQARRIAIAATAFAIFGTLVGLAAIATDRQDIPDLTYHASILAVLLITAIILVRPRRR